MERRHPNVVNLDELPAVEGPRSGAFRSLIRPLGRSTGGQKLGCSFYEVEPGAVAFPFHWHGANDEALIIVSGAGTVRIGPAEIPVRAGDYVAFPAGSEHAHQLRNTGTETLRYYAMSTMIYPEVAGYPDSNKLGVLAPPTRYVFHTDDARDYFDGEPLAKE
jgi:uncharacterized cupin superfamily protein